MSRAFGDRLLKRYVVAEPEIQVFFSLNADREFLPNTSYQSSFCVSYHVASLLFFFLINTLLVCLTWIRCSQKLEYML